MPPNGFHKKSAQTDCSKEMWIPILKRLKHLNLVIRGQQTIYKKHRVCLDAFCIRIRTRRGIYGQI